MKITARADGAADTIEIGWSSSNHTDSQPLLPGVMLIGRSFELRPEAALLAAAILLGPRAGESFDSGCGPISPDLAAAIRALVGDDVDCAPMDNLRRDLLGGGPDMVVGVAGSDLTPPWPPGFGALVPPVELTWSGDFATPERRNSTGYRFGAVRTNAALLVPDAEVSVIVGLLASAGRVRRLLVVDAVTDMSRAERCIRALGYMGIALEFAERRP